MFRLATAGVRSAGGARAWAAAGAQAWQSTAAQGVEVTESGEVVVAPDSGIKWVSLAPVVDEVDPAEVEAAAAHRRVGMYLKMSRRQIQRRYKRLYRSTLKLAKRKKTAKVAKNSVRIRELEMFIAAAGGSLTDEHMKPWTMAKPSEDAYRAQEAAVASSIAEWKDVFSREEQQRTTKGNVMLDIFKGEFDA
ncbi:uncharacterized protein AMSG_07240 [Thecamonas trahens ATCC 50062]|uniref:Uncharacterized protein n=1 Tax=Thecamonas trahens ATCC 50062 TaxID=461836 RepID=A0A0L0DIU4_THETB|nr:hypothetical protein AMSG_07240 [Thecamonas trahens ATCC 50062]KNC51243.1 hypothetical protein AMSG_07240 [Thecamonas trahens ATCC 50062]|eukprot:XP_013756175.1 hypothetical protein AMSG_07240 [Thecamonas trahens ATCC 50062]